MKYTWDNLEIYGERELKEIIMQQQEQKTISKKNSETYAGIEGEDRIQELELIAFTRTTGEDIENFLADYDSEHGTKLKEEYEKLAYGEDE